MVAILATVFGSLAALLHVYIFVMESVQWSQPRIWKRFGVPDQATAEATKPMAYNQGFYNLFLGLGAALGLVLYWAGAVDVGKTLVLFTTACMVLAALVLTTTGRGYVRAALIQGTLPLIGFVLFALS
jgi:putative membrane protein